MALSERALRGPLKKSLFPQIFIGKDFQAVEPLAQSVEHRPFKSWQGTGIKTTKPFEIENEMWCVKWENEGPLLQIYLYRTSGELVDVCANATERGRDTSYIYKSGKFYLSIEEER